MRRSPSGLAVGLQDDRVELFVELVELAVGFVEVGVVELGEAQLICISRLINPILQL
ncbi:MAG: hypothetical protein AAGD09_07235 [Cyanobacteria bacterium P01_F01_bin.56]